MTEVSGEELMHLFRYCFNLMRRRYHQTVHGKVGTGRDRGKFYLSYVGKTASVKKNWPNGCKSVRLL